MPVDINRLTEGWLELESDPGLFTLLLEDFGVKGVQVEEIYDLQKSLEGPVYGFIFLFRWIEERRSRRKIVDQSETFVKDEDVVNNIFFAQQMVPNSCATHALLSVLLNCPNIHLGATLSRLKAHTSGMCPENKGWAIGNTPELAKAHNSHAMPQAKRRLDKSSGVSTGRYTGEAFHFVSYVPIHGKLFELDGLKPFPMDHGPWGEKEDWTEKFRRVITDRLGIATGEQYHDIRFNLMAVVPDRRLALVHKLKMLKTNRQIVLEALQQLVKLTHPDLTDKESVQNTEEKKEAETSNNKEKKDPPKANNEKVKINGVILDVENSKAVKKEVNDQETCSVSHPILETHNYAKTQVDLSPDTSNSQEEKSNTETKEEKEKDPSMAEFSQDRPTAMVPVENNESASQEPSPNPLTTQANPQTSSALPPTTQESCVMHQESSLSPQAQSGGEQPAPVVPAQTPSAPKATSDAASALAPSTPTPPTTIVVPTVTTTPATQPVSTAQSTSTSPTTATTTAPSTLSALGSHSPCTTQPSCSLPSTTTTSAPATAAASSSTPQSTASASLLCPPGPPDYSTPLTIQTSPAPSTSSTDTSSEVGSAFNSPTQGWGWNSGQSSPTSTKDFKKFVVIRVAGSGDEKADSPSGRTAPNVNNNGKRLSSDTGNASKRVCLENGQKTWEKEGDKPPSTSQDNATATVSKGNSTENDNSLVSEEKKPDAKICNKYPELFEPHTFAPKDLLALLKNLENEISVCDMNLRDENEKRKKYKIDDCRRTHNYDEFICTFLSMLAQQGKLADLVQQHLLLKKPGLPVPRVQRATKKAETRPSPSRRRRGRTKYRKRK